MKKIDDDPEHIIRSFLRKVNPWHVLSLSYLAGISTRKKPTDSELRQLASMPFRQYVALFFASLTVGILAYALVPYHLVRPDGHNSLLTIACANVFFYTLALLVPSWIILPDYYSARFVRQAKRIEALYEVGLFRLAHVEYAYLHLLEFEKNQPSEAERYELMMFGKALADLPSLELRTDYEKVVVSYWTVVRCVCERYPNVYLTEEAHIAASSWKKHIQLLKDLDVGLMLRLYETYQKISIMPDTAVVETAELQPANQLGQITLIFPQ